MDLPDAITKKGVKIPIAQDRVASLQEVESTSQLGLSSKSQLDAVEGVHDGLEGERVLCTDVGSNEHEDDVSSKYNEDQPKSEYSINMVSDTKIEDLPRHVLHLILNKRSTREVAQTCVLSKAWRTMWAEQLYLRLDDAFLKEVINVKPNSRRTSEFVRILNAIMQGHFLKIKEFHLKIPYYFTFEQGRVVKNWLRRLCVRSKNSLEVFFFDNENDEIYFDIPSSVFSFSALKNIMLCCCVVRTPTPDYGGFKHLVRVCFKKIQFTGNFFYCNGEMLLPQLLKLIFQSCTGMENMITVFHAPVLNLLWVDDTPNIQWLSLHKSFPNVRRLGLLPWKEEEDPQQLRKRMNLITFLEKFPKLESLATSGFVLEVLAEGIYLPKNLKMKLDLLTSIILDLFVFDNVYQIEAVVFLLNNSPNVKDLLFWIPERNSGKDINPILNSLEVKGQIKDTTLTSIRSVYSGFENEVSFIKFLLAHSPVLEKVTIDVTENVDAVDRLVVLDQLTMYTHASPRVVINITDF